MPDVCNFNIQCQNYKKTHNYKFRELIEIKKSATYKPVYSETIKIFIQENDKGYVLYNGEKRIAKDNIVAQNYQDYLEGTET